MLATFWSPKGGSGTSVVAAAVATRAGTPDRPAVFVDLDGTAADLFAVDLPGPGIREWLAIDQEPPADVVARLGVEVTDRVTVVPLGRGPSGDEGRGLLLAQLLAMHDHDIVVDAGTLRGRGSIVARAVHDASDHSVIVVRPCYLALRRAQRAAWAASEAVVVREPGRALTRRDVAQVLGVPVRAEVPVDASIARAVDAGLIARRVPRVLDRGVRDVATP